MENELNQEIIGLRNRGANVSGDYIIARARVVALNYGYNFKGSNGWLYNFLKSN
jgi:hypothetical protein